jgi:hypothetical protein
LWTAIVVLFVLVSTPLDVLLILSGWILNAMQSSAGLVQLLSEEWKQYLFSDRQKLLAQITTFIIVPSKTIAFIAAVVTLGYPIFAGVRDARWIRESAGLKNRAAFALKIMVLLALLVIPLGLQSLGGHYGRMSLSPFELNFGMFYRRMMMPGMAHLVGMTGYLFYWVFSLCCTYALIFSVLLWLESRNVHLSLFMGVSLMTGSFVIYNFQMPGYPDQLVFIMVLVVAAIPAGKHARLGTVALALATHEASILVLLPVVALLFPESERKSAFLVIGMYVFIALAGIGFDLPNLLEAHAVTETGADSTLKHVVDHPGLGLLGVLFSLKLLWLLIGLGVGVAIRAREARLAWKALCMIAAPAVLMPVTLDTSRFMGYGLMGLLLLVQFLSVQGLLERPLVKGIFWLNIAVPSFYVGLNVGIVCAPGVYRLIYGWLC